jgi:hypothetical protein
MNKYTGFLFVIIYLLIGCSRSKNKIDIKVMTMNVRYDYPDDSIPALKDAYIISDKKPIGPAYTFNGFSDKPGNVRVDYIFVKNGLRVLNHSTLDI